MYAKLLRVELRLDHPNNDEDGNQSIANQRKPLLPTKRCNFNIVTIRQDNLCMIYI